MLQKIFLLLCIVFTFNLNGQTLKINYSETKDLSDLNEKLASIPESMRAMIKEKMSKPVEFELTSCNGISIYKLFGKETENILYKNHVDTKLVEQKNFLDKLFLIEEKLEAKEWVFHDETKTIGNFECKKATLDDKVTAWYTKELPISDGPGNYFIPSALILSLERGVSTTTVTSMNLIQENTELLSPTEGEKVTREELKKIQKEKLEAMKSGGGIISM